MGQYRVDDYEVVYLPKNLNVEQLMNAHPPVLNVYPHNRWRAIERVCVILGQIYRRRFIDKRIEVDEFVRLHSSILEKLVRGYAQILTWAQEVEIIEIDESYQVDVKSRGYRFTEGYRSYEASQTVFIYDPKLYKKIRARRIDQSSIEALPKLYEYLTKISLDGDHAFEILEGFKGHRRSFNERKVEAILERRFYFNRDKKVVRLHTSVVGLKRELRQALRYDGQELINVDIKNSQPFFSVALLTAHAYEVLGVAKILKNYDSEIDLGYIENRLDSYDSTYIKSVLAGELYDNLASELQIERRKAKNLVFDILFSPPKWTFPNKDLFINHFPQEWDLFATINSRFHKTAKQGRKDSDQSNTLALTLQRIESKVFLDHIVPRILESHPELPIWTLHDSIMTLKGQEEAISEVIKKVCGELIECTPTLECI